MTKPDNGIGVYYYDLCQGFYQGCYAVIGTYIFKSATIPTSIDIAREIGNKRSKNYVPYVYVCNLKQSGEEPYLTNGNKTLYISNIRKIQ